VGPTGKCFPILKWPEPEVDHSHVYIMSSLRMSVTDSSISCRYEAGRDEFIIAIHYRGIINTLRFTLKISNIKQRSVTS